MARNHKDDDKEEENVTEEKDLETKEESNNENKRKRKRKRKRKDKTANEDADADDKKTNDNSNDNQDAVEDDEHRKKTEQVHRTLYMEGMPFHYTRQQVLDFFTEHDIAETQIVDLRLPVWQDTGRLRGYGHVVLESQEDYDKALALNRQHMGQRYVTIQPAQAPKSHQHNNHNPADATVNPSRTIILNNLSYQANEEDIQAALERIFAKLNKNDNALELADGGIRVVRHSATGQSKGFGYVEFVNQDDAVALMKYSQTSKLVICGRPTRMDYDHGRVRGSFRTADRKLWHKEYNDGKRQRAS